MDYSDGNIGTVTDSYHLISEQTVELNTRHQKFPRDPHPFARSSSTLISEILKGELCYLGLTLQLLSYMCCLEGRCWVQQWDRVLLCTNQEFWTPKSHSTRLVVAVQMIKSKISLSKENDTISQIDQSCHHVFTLLICHFWVVFKRSV